MRNSETLQPSAPTTSAALRANETESADDSGIRFDPRTTWPGVQHREPPIWLPGWSIRRPLATWLRNEGQRATGLRILDVGCGTKPYLPFFRGASSYVGVDLEGNPHADLISSIDELPIADKSVDLVLCTQVLEHVDDPAAAVREIHRVLAPGGRVLASTHGTMLYHPSPTDFWRWTHTGLQRLFEQGADWADVRVEPGAGAASCMAMLASQYLHLLAKQARVPALARPAIVALNSIGWAADACIGSLREPRPGALFANLHLTAVKAVDADCHQ